MILISLIANEGDEAPTGQGRRRSLVCVFAIDTIHIIRQLPLGGFLFWMRVRGNND